MMEDIIQPQPQSEQMVELLQISIYMPVGGGQLAQNTKANPMLAADHATLRQVALALIGSATDFVRNVEAGQIRPPGIIIPAGGLLRN